MKASPQSIRRRSRLPGPSTWPDDQANAGVVLPVVGGHVEGLYLGKPAEVSRFGLADPRVRLAMNLYGAPAMVPKAFASYRQPDHRRTSLTLRH